jgi:hypothetical protein
MATDFALSLIFAAIAILIAVTLVGPVADGVAAAKASTNVSGSLDTLLDIVPLIFVAGIIVSVALSGLFAFRAFKK